MEESCLYVQNYFVIIIKFVYYNQKLQQISQII